MKEKLIRVYLVFAAVFGILYMIVMPFPTAPDENRHFLKIYAMTEGIFFPSEQVSLPGNLQFDDQFHYKYSDGDIYAGLSADYDHMQWYDLSSTTLYFPLAYAPQTVGVLIAKCFTGNLCTICLTGRIFGYIFSVLMICFAINIMPFKKELVFMTAMLPIFMQESVSLAGDSVENALIMVFVSFTLAMRYGSEKRVWPLYVLAPLIGLCKMFYLPLILLVLLTGTRTRTKITVMAEALIINVLWLLSASGQPTHYNTGADGAAQLKYILASPIRYIGVIGNTVAADGRTWLRQVMGGNLGWISINVFMPAILLYLILYMYVALNRSEKKVTWNDRLVIIAADLLIFLIIVTGEYMQWTVVGAGIVDGVQGRYFVPLLIITAMLFSNKILQLPKKHLSKVIFIYTALYNIIALVTVYRNYSGR